MGKRKEPIPIQTSTTKGGRVNAFIIVFLVSYSMLVIEVVAGRILAPHVGVSLYTWTSIIGVVLAGISAGAYLGGVMADRFPRLPTLGWILFISSLAVFSISPLINWIGETVFHTHLMVRILWVTAIVFFVPSCLLGMVSPLVVKLALSHLKETGSVVGKIYAFSTVGSILGTFTAGFFLISWMGTRNLLFAIGVLLLLAAPLFGGFLTEKKRIGIFLAILLLLWPLYRYASSPVLDKETFFFKESNYFTIKLKKEPGSPADPLITLYLDNLSHSRSDPGNPLRLDFRYIRSYEEIVRWWTSKRESFKALFIGGGGYTFPRFIETRYPKAEIEVIEIDPEVTQVSRSHLGLSPTSKIQTFNEDARWFLMNLKGEGRYDLIFEDAFNDLSIPYHLTTQEFAVQLKRLLKKDGLLLTNVIDRFEKGSFLPSYIRTLEQVFGRGNVHLITLGELRDYTGVTNRIVVTSPQKLEIMDLAKGLNSLGENERMSYIVPQEFLQRYLRQFAPIILTDDYVPVDNLTAPNFDALYSYGR
jgi:predicted membrane-bound spermidine synthase